MCASADPRLTFRPPPSRGSLALSRAQIFKQWRELAHDHALVRVARRHLTALAAARRLLEWRSAHRASNYLIPPSTLLPLRLPARNNMRTQHVKFREHWEVLWRLPSRACSR